MVFFWNVWKSRNNPKVTSDDPWGWGRSLEWATTCPPPRHNFTQLPKIRSESPAFDLHHPEVALLEYGGGEEEEFDETTADAPSDTGRRAELIHRVAGDTNDLASQYDSTHHGRSPQAEEDQR